MNWFCSLIPLTTMALMVELTLGLPALVSNRRGRLSVGFDPDGPASETESSDRDPIGSMALDSKLSPHRPATISSSSSAALATHKALTLAHYAPPLPARSDMFDESDEPSGPNNVADYENDPGHAAHSIYDAEEIEANRHLNSVSGVKPFRVPIHPGPAPIGQQPSLFIATIDKQPSKRPKLIKANLTPTVGTTKKVPPPATTRPSRFGMPATRPALPSPDSFNPDREDRRPTSAVTNFANRFSGSPSSPTPNRDRLPELITNGQLPSWFLSRPSSSTDQNRPATLSQLVGRWILRPLASLLAVH